MNNSINWTGNRVLDPNTSRQMQQPMQSQMQQPMTQMPQSQMQQPMTQMPQSSQTMPARQMPPPAMQIGQLQQAGVTQQGPPPSTEKGYIPNYLASNIGKYARAEFIIGTSQYADKTGVIAEVGINYFVLNDINSHTMVMCDLYSVKFVTIPEAQVPTVIQPT